MSLDIEEFRGYLKIDKLALDDDLRQQPSLLFEVSSAYETALAQRDSLKDALATTEAEIDADLRELAEKAKDKCTETQFKNMVLTDKDRKAAYNRYAKAREWCGQLSALKEAFVQRGYALRELAGLYTSNYFQQNSSRPTTDTDKVLYEANKAKMNAARERHRS